MHSGLRQFIARQGSKLIAKEEEDRWSTAYAKYLAKWEPSSWARLILSSSLYYLWHYFSLYELLTQELAW